LHHVDSARGMPPQRGDGLLRVGGVAQKRHDDDEYRGADEFGGHEIRRRGQDGRQGRHQVLGRRGSLDVVAVAPHDVAGAFVVGHDQQAGHDQRGHRMHAELEGRHDAEIRAGPAQCPHQLRVRVVGDMHQLPARGQQIGAEEVVAGESVLG
jgi:hypothetical protein